MASLLDGTLGTENARDIRVEGDTLPASPDAATHDTLLSSLSAPQRIAYLMCERGGLSDRAIAAHLHIDPAEARRLIYEARLELRRPRSTEATGERTR